MINAIWMFLMVSGILYAGLTGRMELVTQSVITAAENAVALALKLTGVMCLWLGMLRIAELAGIVRGFSFLLSPLLRFIFPSIPPNHPALGAIVMTLSANMLGMGNAVTPLGIKAMQELQKINPRKDTASDSMCTLLALCTTGFTLVPATIIAIRSAAGSSSPADIMGATLIVSLLATGIALTADFICRIFFAKQTRRF